MSTNESGAGSPPCQICGMQRVSEPMAKSEVVQPPLRGRLKVLLKRWLSPSMKRTLKLRMNRMARWFSKLTGRSQVKATPTTQPATSHLKAGDLVRVRSREEIQATLDIWKELKGCLFMPEMWSYCGTTQRVLKSVERIVDERDYRVKRCRGVILLEGVICPGTELFGRCDRSCFFFWREEWLEKIEDA